MDAKQAVGRWLMRFAFVRRAVESEADFSAFRKPPSFKLLLGLFLIVLSSLMGWPSVAFFTCLAVHLKNAWWAGVGPVVYAASIPIWTAGLALTGIENVKIAGVFFAWLARVTVLRLLDDAKSDSGD